MKAHDQQHDGSTENLPRERKAARQPGCRSRFLCAWDEGIIRRLLAGLPVLLALSSSAADPVLEATRQTNCLVVRWPTNATGLRLEESDALPPIWTATPGEPQAVGGYFAQSLVMSNRSRFFRLGSPALTVMGLVQDPEGRAIANAVVGGAQLTDESGVVFGAVGVSASGWVAVTAPGFATGYLKSTVRTGPTHLLEGWLTPLTSRVQLNGGESARLFLGTAQAPAFDLTVSGTDFTDAPIDIGFTEIHPLDVGPLFARLNPREDRFLSQAFALQASDLAGHPGALAAGRSITIHIRDQGGTNPPPRFARFDPEAGTWLMLSNACERTGSNRLACVVSRLSPLLGLFEVGEAPYLDAASAGQPASGGLDALRPAAVDESVYDQAYKRHRARLLHRLNEIADILEQGGQIDPNQDAEVRQILDDLVRQARDYATAHPNERGKLKLLHAAEHASRLGQAELGEQLMSEATQIANDLARDLLSGGDCGRVREMLNVQGQLMMMGGDEALIDGLKQKIDRLFNECDLWIGTVRFVSFTSPAHPGLPDFTLCSGSASWSELHDIKMATHAKTLVLKGEDLIKLNFPEVVFEDGNEPCEQTMTFFGRPSPASIVMNFDGTYDGRTFNLGGLLAAPGAQPISIVQRWSFQSEEDDACVLRPPYPIEFPFPNYYSVIRHGYDHIASPPITLQEMLETGVQSQGPFGDVISGYESISNEFPEPNAGRYPFISGLMTWRFIHVKKLLPLQR